MNTITWDDIAIENILPQDDFMLISPMRQEEKKTKGGIIVSDVGNMGATPTIGEVVKRGPNARFDIGTTVMFRKYSVDEIAIKQIGTMYFIANEDVICEFKKHGTTNGT